MTTTVTIKACCADTKEVRVSVSGQHHTTLQNGEKTELYAYDDRVIEVKEVVKEAP